MLQLNKYQIPNTNTGSASDFSGMRSELLRPNSHGMASRVPGSTAPTRIDLHCRSFSVLRVDVTCESPGARDAAVSFLRAATGAGPAAANEPEWDKRGGGERARVGRARRRRTSPSGTSAVLPSAARGCRDACAASSTRPSWRASGSRWCCWTSSCSRWTSRCTRALRCPRGYAWRPCFQNILSTPERDGTQRGAATWRRQLHTQQIKISNQMYLLAHGTSPCARLLSYSVIAVGQQVSVYSVCGGFMRCRSVRAPVRSVPCSCTISRLGRCPSDKLKVIHVYVYVVLCCVVWSDDSSTLSPGRGCSQHAQG